MASRDNGIPYTADELRVYAARLKECKFMHNALISEAHYLVKSLGGFEEFDELNKLCSELDTMNSSLEKYESLLELIATGLEQIAVACEGPGCVLYPWNPEC